MAIEMNMLRRLFPGCATAKLCRSIWRVGMEPGSLEFNLWWVVEPKYKALRLHG